MATDRNYRYHSRHYHKMHGYMFGDVVGSGRNKWFFDTETYLQKLIGSSTVPKWFIGCIKDFEPLENQQISLAGQGVLSVIHIYLWKRHTMAFSAGRVYDPAEPYQWNWGQWQQRNPSWQVYNVTQMKRK